MADEKKCSTCGQVKSLDRFALHKNCIGGRRGQCKNCVAAWMIADRVANPDKYHEIDRLRRPPGSPKVRARNAKYYQENIEKCRAQSRAWHHNNPEKSKARSSNKNARKRNASGVHTATDIAWLFNLQKGKCAYQWCRASLKKSRHVDHVIPLVLGGSNNRHNLQLLCPSCNLKKGSKHPADFAQQYGALL